MSGPDQEISTSGGGGGSGGDEEEDGVGSPSKKDGFKEEDAQKTEREAERVSVFRFGQAKKTLQLLRSRYRRRRRKKKKGGLVNSGCFGGLGDGVIGCCLCGKQSPTLDSSGSGESPCSDPNSKDFTFDRLKVFIETNDFYAKECNPHFDCD